MRPTALALLALLAAGCGGDEPDGAQPPNDGPRSAPQQPLSDTTPAETSATTGAEAPTGAGETAPAAPAGTTQPPEGDRAGTATADAGGAARYTVQVAAFLEPASATELTRRLESEGLPVWRSVAEHGGRTFYRVRLGAVPTVSDARRLGSMITERYEWPVWVAPLTAADRPPEGAARETQRVLESG